LIVGRPDWGLILVAGWTVLSSAILLTRLFQGIYHRLTSGPLHPWLNTSRQSSPTTELPAAPARSGRPTIA